MPDQSYYERNKDKIKARAKAWKLANPDKVRKSNRESIARARVADPEKYRESSNRFRSTHQKECQARTVDWARRKQGIYLLYNCKYRAKREGLAFNITLEDIPIPEACPVLGIPLRSQDGRRGFYPNSPSVDKIVPALGYVRGNVRVISVRANMIKRDATPEDIVKVAAWVQQEYLRVCTELAG